MTFFLRACLDSAAYGSAARALPFDVAFCRFTVGGDRLIKSDAFSPGALSIVFMVSRFFLGAGRQGRLLTCESRGFSRFLFRCFRCFRFRFPCWYEEDFVMGVKCDFFIASLCGFGSLRLCCQSPVFRSGFRFFHY